MGRRRSSGLFQILRLRDEGRERSLVKRETGEVSDSDSDRVESSKGEIDRRKGTTTDL